MEIDVSQKSTYKCKYIQCICGGWCLFWRPPTNLPIYRHRCHSVAICDDLQFGWWRRWQIIQFVWFLTVIHCTGFSWSNSVSHCTYSCILLIQLFSFDYFLKGYKEFLLQLTFVIKFWLLHSYRNCWILQLIAIFCHKSLKAFNAFKMDTREKSQRWKFKNVCVKYHLIMDSH